MKRGISIVADTLSLFDLPYWTQNRGTSWTLWMLFRHGSRGTSSCQEEAAGVSIMALIHARGDSDDSYIIIMSYFGCCSVFFMDWTLRSLKAFPDF